MDGGPAAAASDAEVGKRGSKIAATTIPMTASRTSHLFRMPPSFDKVFHDLLIALLAWTLAGALVPENARALLLFGGRPSSRNVRR